MRVIPNGSNQTILEGKGCRVLYSYETPVALEAPNGKYYRTDQKWSVTTSKHINYIAGKWGATVRKGK